MSENVNTCATCEQEVASSEFGQHACIEKAPKVQTFSMTQNNLLIFTFPENWTMERIHHAAEYTTKFIKENYPHTKALFYAGNVKVEVIF